MIVTHTGDATFPVEFAVIVEDERELADLYCRLGILEEQELEREFSHLIGRIDRPLWTESEEFFEEVAEVLKERLTELR